MTTVFDDVISVLKKKFSTNLLFFKVLAPLTISDLGIDIEKDATLYKANLQAIDPNETYLSIMYESDSNEAKEEGLVRMPFETLAACLYAKKLSAFNINTNNLDSDIAKFLR